MNRAFAFTSGGFLMVLWGLCSALLGQSVLAGLMGFFGTIFFAGGFVQLAKRPKAVASWLEANF